MEDVDEFNTGIITGVCGTIIAILAILGWVHLVSWIINQF